MKLTRPTFDVACATVAQAHPELTLTVVDAIWTALVPEAAQSPYGTRVWTPEARALLVPLMREIETVRKQDQRGTIKERYAGISVPMQRKSGLTHVNLLDLYATYRTRLDDIYRRMTFALRTGGHWRAPGDPLTDVDGLPALQPIRVIVANELAAKRFAGNSNWTQWETPNILRNTCDIFDRARDVTTRNSRKRGAQWMPYQPAGVRKRGDAENSRALRAWNTAFHNAIHSNAFDAFSPDAADPCAARLGRFYATLRSTPVQQAIQQATHEQLVARRGPSNRAFVPTRNELRTVWHALNPQTRIELASEFERALRDCMDLCHAVGKPDEARNFDPSVIPNPFALTEEERASLAPTTTYIEAPRAPAPQPAPESMSAWDED